MWMRFNWFFLNYHTVLLWKCQQVRAKHLKNGQKHQRAKREANKAQAEKRKADRAEKAKAKAKTPAKKTKPPAKTTAKKARASTSRQRYSSDEDQDFCIVCSQFLPRNGLNTVECNRKCGIVVHLKCAKAQGRRFVCEHCDPDLDELFSEAEDEPMDE